MPARATFPNTCEATWYPVYLADGDNVVVPGVEGYSVVVLDIELTPTDSEPTTYIFKDGLVARGQLTFNAISEDWTNKPLICAYGNDFGINADSPTTGMVLAKYAGPNT
jgi:hypothetical protein